MPQRRSDDQAAALIIGAVWPDDDANRGELVRLRTNDGEYNP